MELIESNRMNTYRILVKETQDHHTTEWFGSLKLIPQEDGETFLDISITDQEVLYDSKDQSWDPNIAILSIEFIENGDFQEVDI